MVSVPPDLQQCADEPARHRQWRHAAVAWRASLRLIWARSARRMRPLLILCLAAALVLGGNAGAAAPPGSFVPAKDLAELQLRLGAILKANGVPGMAAVIATRDRIVWTAGIGLADV